MAHVLRVWEIPPSGYVKVNVHSHFVQNPPDDQNRNGIGVVIRDDTGKLLKLTYGTIPGMTNLNSALWAILIGMRRSFQDGHWRVIIETDNSQAYRECKYFEEEGITAHTRDTLRYILSRLKDPNISYDLKLIHAERNGVARRLATLGREMHDLQTFTTPVDNIQDFLNIDMGIGPPQARFHDMEMNNEGEEVDQGGQIMHF